MDNKNILNYLHKHIKFSLYYLALYIYIKLNNLYKSKFFSYKNQKEA